MESLLGLPPMNNNDAFSSLIATCLPGPATSRPTRRYSNRDNNLIYTANAKTCARARREHEDGLSATRIGPMREKLNVILWKDAMGNAPVPAMLTQHHAKARRDDDD